VQGGGPPELGKVGNIILFGMRCICRFCTPCTKLMFILPTQAHLLLITSVIAALLRLPSSLGFHQAFCTVSNPTCRRTVGQQLAASYYT
jgi:hypothetical protein